MIDYVIPMVFDNDLAWRDNFRHSRWRTYTRQDREVSRFRSMGTEELFVRCIRAFMPFVGTIHILLARESQKQPWMDKYGIHVVYHRDFIPMRYLPTFNSRSIEMFLHRIPGLSEQFIYSNDDMFPVAPMSEEDFFRDGNPCMYAEFKELPKDYSQFGWVCKEGLKLISEGNGTPAPDNYWLFTGHGVTPLLKSVCGKVFATYEEQIRNSITFERDWKNYNQYIYAYYQFYNELVVKKDNDTAYADNTMPLADVEKTIMKADRMVCVNDAIKSNDFEKFTAVVSAAIEKRLQTYLEKTNYGKGTESDTAGDQHSATPSVADEQRPGNSGDTTHKEKIQDQVAEKRSTGKANPPSLAKGGRGKTQKDNRKRGFGFHS